MCYRIQSSADVPAEIARIAREQLAQAVKELSSKNSPADKIHNVRRCLKRLRSLLKLIHPYIPSQFFEAENQRFRDLGRAVAPIRDYYVTLQTFDGLKLAKRLRSQLQQDLDEAIDVKKRVAELTASVPAQKKGLQPGFQGQLNDALRTFDWPVPEIEVEELAVGLENVYRSARKAFKKALKSPLPANLHCWRQRVKVLEHSYRLVEAFCPKSIGRKAKKSDKLADVLGNFNDLHLLASHLKKLEIQSGETKDALDILSRKSKKLLKCAVKLGETVFETRPGVLGRKYRSILSSKTTYD